MLVVTLTVHNHYFFIIIYFSHGIIQFLKKIISRVLRLKNLFQLSTFACKVLVLLIECFHSRGQYICKFIGTKESVCIRKEFNSQRIVAPLQPVTRPPLGLPEFRYCYWCLKTTWCQISRGFLEFLLGSRAMLKIFATMRVQFLCLTYTLKHYVNTV